MGAPGMSKLPTPSSLTQPSADLSRRERCSFLPLPPGEGWGEGAWDGQNAYPPLPSPSLRLTSPGGRGALFSLSPRERVGVRAPGMSKLPAPSSFTQPAADLSRGERCSFFPLPPGEGWGEGARDEQIACPFFPHPAFG